MQEFKEIWLLKLRNKYTVNIVSCQEILRE
jgi:hypothetical protein